MLSPTSTSEDSGLDGSEAAEVQPEENEGRVRQVLLHGSPEEQCLLEIKLLELALDERRKTINTNTEKARRISRYLKREVGLLESLTFEFQVKPPGYRPHYRPGGSKSAGLPSKRSKTPLQNAAKPPANHTRGPNNIMPELAATGFSRPESLASKSRCSTAVSRCLGEVRLPMVKMESVRLKNNEKDGRLKRLETQVLGRADASKNFMLCSSSIQLHARAATSRQRRARDP